MSNSMLKNTFAIICAQVAVCALVWTQCPSRCSCPAEHPPCAPGVSIILDDCACCVVCARQHGELCSQTSPCETRKGLRCVYGGGAHKRTGVCVAHEGDACLLGGTFYQNGDVFFPSCKYQCICKDGQIGCVPRCKLDVMLPGPDCPFPRSIQVPGECCEKWVCDSHAEISALGGFAMAAYRQEETVGIGQWDSSVNCIEQTTEWSACSKTCGMGMSTRVTNKNQHCEMIKQSRLCMIRPCESLNKQRTTTREDRCLRTRRNTETYFTFKNCTSVQSYKPQFCGLCRDGRCCTPHSTKTAQVEFQCPEGKIIRRPMMFINTCVSHHHCPRDNNINQLSASTGYSGLQL
ncbi:CCN family member 3-like [Megalobrama amblycephala]|uniref:CCN family member 3-like n=1 Tax=Megalobrama amblycephala TaxID=75352 RepID=UPI0020146097|nr:CCN family member 3-like [Megalobrama amblycephala]